MVGSTVSVNSTLFFLELQRGGVNNKEEKALCLCEWRECCACFFFFFCCCCLYVVGLAVGVRETFYYEDTL